MSQNFILSLSSVIGRVVSTFVQAGRESVKLMLSTVLPFMVFVSALVGIIMGSGLGQRIADGLAALAGNPWGLLALGMVSAIPVLSPILGPGAVIPQTIGVLVGTLIASGKIPPHLALPALFAIHQPVGADFIPVGLSLTEAEPETAEVGVPAVLYAKFLVAPIEVGAALAVSFFIYQ